MTSPNQPVLPSEQLRAESKEGTLPSMFDKLLEEDLRFDDMTADDFEDMLAGSMERLEASEIDEALDRLGEARKQYRQGKVARAYARRVGRIVAQLARASVKVATSGVV